MPSSRTGDRQVLLEWFDEVSLYIHDPHVQIFSKIVRGFDSDIEDAGFFVSSAVVEAERLRELVHEIPAHAWVKYQRSRKRAYWKRSTIFCGSSTAGQGRRSGVAETPDTVGA